MVTSNLARSFFFSGRPFTLVAKPARSGKLLRSGLLHLSCKPLEVTARASELSHCWVNLLLDLPAPPPKPPDPLENRYLSHPLMIFSSVNLCGLCCSSLPASCPESPPPTYHLSSHDQALLRSSLIMVIGLSCSNNIPSADLWFFSVLTAICLAWLSIQCPPSCFIHSSLFCLVAAEAGQDFGVSSLVASFSRQATTLPREGDSPKAVVFQSFTSPFILSLKSSTASPSFGHLKLFVLFLAGEGTSGSWIPVFVNLHILFRRCITLDLVHVLSIASSILKKPLPGKLCYMVTRVSIWERVSSQSFIRGKRITFALNLPMKGELFSASKPKIFSSFMERVLLSFASMAMAKVEQAVYDHVIVVLGLKKADVKSTSLGGVLLLASGNEFSTRILCSGNSASLSISKEESTHGGYSEFILLFSFYYFSLVVFYCNFRVNSYVGSLPP